MEIPLTRPGFSWAKYRDTRARVRGAIAALGRSKPHTVITACFGVAVWRPGRPAEQVLEAADGMLHAAKRAGKDRIMTRQRCPRPTPSPCLP